MYRRSDRTSQKTQSASIVGSNWLPLFLVIQTLIVLRTVRMSQTVNSAARQNEELLESFHYVIRTNKMHVSSLMI